MIMLSIHNVNLFDMYSCRGVGHGVDTFDVLNKRDRHRDMHCIHRDCYCTSTETVTATVIETITVTDTVIHP